MAPNDAKLAPRDRELAALLATGLSEPEAAARLHISRATVTRTKQKPGFRELVYAIRDDAADRIVGALGEVAADAVSTLRALLSAPSPAVKLGAVRTALEFLIRGREHAELARRIADLERADDSDTTGEAGAGADDPPGESAEPSHPGATPAEPGAGATPGRPVAGGAHPGAAFPHAGGVLPPVG